MGQVDSASSDANLTANGTLLEYKRLIFQKSSSNDSTSADSKIQQSIEDYESVSININNIPEV